VQVWEKFKRLWKHYIFQSLLAGLAIFIVVLTVGEDKAVVIASMAATAMAVTINEVTLTAAVIVIISVIVLTQCRYYMRNLLKDLI